MYHIAICDDNQEFISYLKKILCEDTKENKDYFKIYTLNEQDVLDKENDTKFDLLIADMKYDNINDMAEHFHKENPEGILIYTSDVKEHSILSIKHSPYQYI